MIRKQHRIHQTELDNLVSNLRGEVGEVITAWILWRWIRAQQTTLQSPDIAADMQNPDLIVVNILGKKLQDDLIARLSELGQEKVGRLTFHFASKKIGSFEAEAQAFMRFVRANGFNEKRNLDISHKELPETWDQHRFRMISHWTILRAIALALRLMKKIDEEVYGPSIIRQWQEVRRRRYAPMYPPSAGYLILPYIVLMDQAKGPRRPMGRL